jgi:hypothetical protein
LPLHRSGRRADPQWPPVLCLTILPTRKTTGDSIPTSLRDNSGLAVSFALKTTESSVAALGEAPERYARLLY